MEKKIYITALHLMHGGVEMSISLIANALVERGYYVEIISSYNLGEPVYNLNPKVKITYLTDLKPNKEEIKAALKGKNIKAIIKEGFYALKVLKYKKTTMIETIKSIEDGTIISTRNEHSVLLSKYGNNSVKKIAQLHHDHEFKENFIKDFKHNYSNIDIFVLLTELLKEEVEEMMKGHNEKTKCICIPNFLKNESIERMPEKQNQVIALGRLHNVKGFDRLLDIWARVTVECPQWKLKIVGGGEEEGNLKNKIAELKIQDSAILTGPLSHEKAMEEVKKSSIFAMTSHSEGFPFVLIEALMCSTPIVAFDVRVGPRAIVEHGKEGYLIEDKNIDEYAKVLIRIMQNEHIRNKLSEAAYEKSKEFTEEKIIKKWIDII